MTARTFSILFICGSSFDIISIWLYSMYYTFEELPSYTYFPVYLVALCFIYHRHSTNVWYVLILICSFYGICDIYAVSFIYSRIMYFHLFNDGVSQHLRRLAFPAPGATAGPVRLRCHSSRLTCILPFLIVDLPRSYLPSHHVTSFCISHLPFDTAYTIFWLAGRREVKSSPSIYVYFVPFLLLFFLHRRRDDRHTYPTRLRWTLFTCRMSPWAFWPFAFL